MQRLPHSRYAELLLRTCSVVLAEAAARRYTCGYADMMSSSSFDGVHHLSRILVALFHCVVPSSAAGGAPALTTCANFQFFLFARGVHRTHCSRRTLRGGARGGTGAAEQRNRSASVFALYV